MARNEVTIDTNVFVHLFNPQNNTGNHIDRLLHSLVEKQARLCVDDKNRIFGEYKIHIGPLFKAKSDQDLRLFWLRYFLIDEPPNELPVNFGDALMVAIKGQMRGTEPSDHVFVYVAISSNTVLVSNNQGHITDRRRELRKCAKN